MTEVQTLSCIIHKIYKHGCDDRDLTRALKLLEKYDEPNDVSPHTREHIDTAIAGIQEAIKLLMTIETNEKRIYTGKGKYGSEIHIDFDAPPKEEHISDILLGKPSYDVSVKVEP